jgi:hypothetical protein
VNIGNQARHESTLEEMKAPRYEFITSLYVARRPGRFNPGETTTVTQGTGGLVGPQPARQLRRGIFFTASGNRTTDSAVIQSVAHSYAKYSQMNTVEWNVPQGGSKLAVI